MASEAMMCTCGSLARILVVDAYILWHLACLKSILVLTCNAQLILDAQSRTLSPNPVW